MTLKTGDVFVPPSRSRQIVLGRGVVRDGAVGAPFRRPADAAAGFDVGIAVELLAIGRERCCVLVVRGCEVGACVHGVDIVGAVACGVGAGADEDLFIMDDGIRNRKPSQVKSGTRPVGRGRDLNLHRRGHACRKAWLLRGGRSQGPSSG